MYMSMAIIIVPGAADRLGAVEENALPLPGPSLGSGATFGGFRVVGGGRRYSCRQPIAIFHFRLRITYRVKRPEKR